MKLSDSDKEVINLRYGNDLDNPVVSDKWNNSYNNRLYRVVFPNINELLRAKDEVVDNDNNSDVKSFCEEKVCEEDLIAKDDYYQLMDFIKTFGLINGSNKEMVVISLKVGFVNDNYYSNEAIANFLGINEEEVISIVKEGLILYKNKINNLLNTFGDILLEDKGFERIRND